VFILDYGHREVIWREYTTAGPQDVRLINLRFSWRIQLRNNVFRLLIEAAFLKWLLPARLAKRIIRRHPVFAKVIGGEFLALSGGDSLSDIYGLRRLAYVLLPQILVLMLEQRLVMLPQSYGPFRTRLAKWAAGWVLKRSCRIFTREVGGSKAVEAVAGRKDAPEVEMFPDIGFALEARPLPLTQAQRLDALKGRGGIVGINVSALLYRGGYSGRNMFGLFECYRELVPRIIEWLLERTDRNVLLIPHVWGVLGSQEDESRLCRQLARIGADRWAGRLAALEDTLDHREVKSAIGACECFVGSRMHACIAAASQAVPCLALSYSPKFSGTLGAVGEGVRVIDLRREGFDDITRRLASMLAELPAMKRALEMRLPEIKRALTRLGEVCVAGHT
jgi:polysaccharide pyruvyl transferase WcaK-like protein